MNEHAAAVTQAMHSHPWVAQAQWSAAGVVLQPTSEGVSALCQRGRRAFIQALNDQLANYGLGTPASWRLIEAWPVDAPDDWADALLALPRPMEAELLSEQVAGGNALLVLRIPLDLQHFDVHFPDLPILPGVVQVAWALTHGAARFGTPTTCRRVEMLKFQRPLRPGELVQLSLRYDATLRRLQFGYASHDVLHASGRLQWDRIDG
jgi:3-hydroxymyristoyl/3-hydroxydecanoyl-(acyl carrier protein) dehydratase